MKKYIIAATVLIAGTASAQQLGQYSQYLQNNFIINPAATGVEGHLDLKLSFRKQWVGFVGNEAPQTAYFSANWGIGKKRGTRPISKSLRISKPDMFETLGKVSGNKLSHGIGALFVNDRYGHFVRNSGYLSYALHMPVTNDLYVSGGLSAGGSNIVLNTADIVLADQVDATFGNVGGGKLSKTLVDLNAGIWVYNSRLFVGYASNQLLQNKIQFGSNIADNKLNVHHFITAGYKIKINDDLDVTPSAHVKYMTPAPISMDFNARVTYQDKFWGGISYRLQESIVGLVGMELNEMFNIGYAYDYTISGLRSYNTGTHEVVLGAKLFRNEIQPTKSMMD